MKIMIEESDIRAAEVGETGAFMLELDFTPEAWRKLYAGMALQGLCANQEWSTVALKGTPKGGLDNAVANAALVMADAMLQNLDSPPDPDQT